MADNSFEASVPDEAVINRSAPEAMRRWVSLLGVEEVRIFIAVAVVGPRYESVRRYLQLPDIPSHAQQPAPVRLSVAF